MCQMRNERIALASCNHQAMVGLNDVFNNWSLEGGHTLAGSIRDARDMNRLKNGEPTTVVLISPNLYLSKQIEETTKWLRSEFPGIILIAVTEAKEKPEWADHALPYKNGGKNIMDFVTELQH